MVNHFHSSLFLENIEWFDESGQELVHRLPETGSGEIKFGAQLTVRESQAAVLFCQGKACDSFGPGRYTLKTWNLPIITKLLSMPWRGDSPLRAEVYMVNMKHFTNLKWGTVNPVAFRDNELGLIRLRGHGIYNIQIVQPVLFINSFVGTMGTIDTAAVSDYLKKVIVSRLNDYLGKTLDTIINLPGRFDDFSQALQRRLAQDFAHFGLRLTHLYTTSITPPDDVQQAIDDKGSMRVINDMDKFLKMKTAMALEKASENSGDGGGGISGGIGLGMGMLMPGLFAQSGMMASQSNDAKHSGTRCPDCDNTIDPGARFCPLCGHQQVVLLQCSHCGKNLTPKARFCSSCGKPVATRPPQRMCPACHQENLPGSMFCNQCGEQLG